MPPKNWSYDDDNGYDFDYAHAKKISNDEEDRRRITVHLRAQAEQLRQEIVAWEP